MARKKTTETFDAEINKIKATMSKLQDRYDKFAQQLADLEEQKRRCQAEKIMDAFLESGKSFDEIMTFLKP
jgi:phage shock protein A